MDTVSLTIHVIVGMLRQLSKSIEDMICDRILQHEINLDLEPADRQGNIEGQAYIPDEETDDEWVEFVNTLKGEIKQVLSRHIKDLEEQLLEGASCVKGTDEDDGENKENELIRFQHFSSKDVCMATVVSFLDTVDAEIDEIFRKYLENFEGEQETLPGARRPSR